ncbi:GH92 family glycosyl hydrolase [Granulicella rosea]|uniref:GH92 family glycosyl hydrolase n=1 Tax=Granulicella rosea TaxID=474952 RepID=UPI001594F1EF|nr:GH92 family glycosyl hydrolase [Granulicella rosea]
MATALLSFAFAASMPAQTRLALVDPLVGSTNGGNTTPGAQIPFGFISLGPDTADVDHGVTNGYNPDAEMIGFSYTHESGTGGEAKYGNFRVTPTMGELSPRNLIYPWRDEHAEPGFYGVTIGKPEAAIRAEHTATRMVGYSRYSFPAGHANLLLDVSSRLRMQGGASGVSSYPQAATDASVTIPDARHAEGSVTVAGGWNPAPYTLYFAMELDRDASANGTWDQNKTYPGRTTARGVDQRAKGYRNQLGAYFTFEDVRPTTVEMRLAVSWVSVAQARRTLADERSLTFDGVRRQAAEQWSRTLEKIDVQGGSEEQRRIFYTALYRAHTMPHDLTGENVWWKSDAPHYEDFYTLWDTFRTLHPLYTLIEPERQTAMVRSLLDTYAHTGWLPDARIAGANGLVQGGSNGDVVIADALVKRLPGVDWKQAYAAVKKDAEVSSVPPGDEGWNEGRQLDEWSRLGYMSLSYQRSASRTLEYAADDYSVATVAHLMGEEKDAARFLKSSGNWRNLWDRKLQCIHPRYADGSYLENFDCDHLYPDYLLLWWDVPFYEGNSAQYSTYIPQDISGLIELLGGKDAATTWLDRLFDQKLYTQGNEPDILAPYTYIYTGRQDRTAERVRAILKSEYHTGRAGLPGNDDAGTMSSWYLWSAIGLYPVAGQPLYLIGSPVFDSATLHLGDARSFTIRAQGGSKSAIYVQSATLNGKPLERAWLTHAEVIGGGELILIMGEKPSRWDKIPPPSGADVWKLIQSAD